MIWSQSGATSDGQTVFMTRGCDGHIAPYYIERAFLNGVTADDVYSCGRDRGKAFATWERIQSQGTCKHLKCFAERAPLREDAEEQIMFYVESLIVYPTDDDAAHVVGSGRGSGASSSGGRQTSVTRQDGAGADEIPE
jgi:hypothetical protein